MKRFILLSLFVLCGGFMAAGYSDSSVSKETPTIQVTSQEVESIVSEFEFSGKTDVQSSESVKVDAPDLGEAKTDYVFKSEKIESVLVGSNLKPPEDRRQKSVYNIHRNYLATA